MIVAGPPFLSEKYSFLAALTYSSFSHCEGKDTELRRTVAELYRLVTERGALQLSMDSYAALYSAVLHL